MGGQEYLILGILLILAGVIAALAVRPRRSRKG